MDHSKKIDEWTDTEQNDAENRVGDGIHLVIDELTTKPCLPVGMALRSEKHFSSRTRQNIRLMKAADVKTND
jgi:hypothetical protein